jgi:hypothetical protein
LRVPPLAECQACHIKPLVVLRHGRCGCVGIKCSPCSAGSRYYYYSSASPLKPAPRRALRLPQPRLRLPIAQPGPRLSRRRHRLRQHHHQALSRRLPRRQCQPRARRCQCQPRPRRRHPRRLLGPRPRHPRPPRSAVIRSPMREIATSRVNSAGNPTTGRVAWRATVNPSFARTTTGGAGNRPDPRRKRGRFHDHALLARGATPGPPGITDFHDPGAFGALFDPDHS